MKSAARQMILDRRREDVRAALESGLGLVDLANAWNVTRPYVSAWCRKYASEDVRQQLADNGHRRGEEKRRGGFCVGPRLELIALCRANGWSYDRIAQALGVQHHAVWEFQRRHAPDGLDAAIADYRDDEPSHS